jgi:hypothetical protein
MHVAFKSVQPWLRLLDNGFCVKKHKDFVFTPKMNHLDVWSYKKRSYVKGGKTDAYN